MFHAINAWLAHLARRICDARLTRNNQIALANEWQVKRVPYISTYRYRDARFDQLASASKQDDAYAPHGVGCACENCPDYDGLEVTPDWGDSDALYQWWSR